MPLPTPLPSLLHESRLVPVVVAAGAEQGRGVAGALIDGGLPVAELTFRTEGALEALAAAVSAYPDALIGAGTVTTPAQVDAAADVGARFIVSPGLSSTVVQRAIERGLPIAPGVATASEVMAALDQGLTELKLFPTEAIGGLPALAALAAPFPQVRFIPTGGITAASAPAYLAHPSVLAVGGSWMVSPSHIAKHDWDAIASATATAVAATTKELV
ncbi:bifunctional 4-hydroxy-2-oxoglutarate aldolase/2-dehydro-3-deoxy-phosphogluconate aldolase [Demequina sediminicola]|uniref:bifunctional 4-hydroxy-2-oxoglutarate aldolase/2-dehydro-3-deoxy-phosphogluconate aldolase n=1 Tax=Demequina sediminicola TaxID=1095026 RepID=UPI000784844C|nr:bifunctional 4-hydroxy-2-oxoglutarate aldolase/2-dehydro-3-deoxy-phosphogluconate aldolase [Demequina sediminicola]